MFNYIVSVTSLVLLQTLDPPKVKRPPPPKTPPKSFTLEEIKAKMSASVQKVS